MSLKDIKNKSKAELEELLKEKRSFLRDFRFKISKGKAKNNKEGQSIRRDIARILTLLNQK